ncbi:hypothetical protein CLV24_102152 [Pontibacter ummariensis]|uniref:Uncharacterized protein n=1 Tax=Pontibacter ummariensis TaxID=1610492 RepID=A0A239C0X1_9BACT|nr:hypothetical protein [Pontibacter ummariensis]PRY15531.1 hypothetical protein CLV24_102152 [Pontibacter ummariensis]SNS13301.1 hypothetical protein SAMN06296052_102260 [Pontibacter ummariensis]
MSELKEFLDKLSACDCNLVVLTLISANRVYCRLFKDGQYIDRVFVNDPLIVTELYKLCGRGEEIDADGIAKLRQKFIAV